MANRDDPVETTHNNNLAQIVKGLEAENSRLNKELIDAENNVK